MQGEPELINHYTHPGTPRHGSFSQALTFVYDCKCYKGNKGLIKEWAVIKVRQW